MQRTKKLIDPYDLTIHLAQKNAKHPLQYDDVLAVIADEKRVEAVEVVHGRWVSRICSYGTPKCSVCDWSIPYSEDSRLDATNYCPNCGAKMDGGN